MDTPHPDNLNPDTANLPSSPRDVQEGVPTLTPSQQVQQLSDFWEDHYPELFISVTTDEGQGLSSIPEELVQRTERLWAQIPDALSHSSLLVLGAGLDHTMPHTAFTATGLRVQSLPLNDLPEGINATVLRPSQPTGAVAVSLHGGPGWFGDGASHEHFWLPLFAALAQRSGVSVVDLTYPLGDWDVARRAVARAVDFIRSAHGQIISDVAPGACGLITFGSGFEVASGCAGEVDFHLAMTPRIFPGCEAAVEKTRVLVSLGAMDTRGTPAAQVREWFDKRGAHYEYREYPSGHIIAAPAVWRERVDDAAQWLAQQ